MTNEEAIKVLRTVKPEAQGYCNGGIELLNNYGGIVVEKAIVALKNADKYRWHDLRKNPNDLPEKSGLYWVHGIWERGKHVEGESEYHVDDGCFIASQDINIIAWKRVEQFEEE